MRSLLFVLFVLVLSACGPKGPGTPGDVFAMAENAFRFKGAAMDTEDNGRNSNAMTAANNKAAGDACDQITVDLTGVEGNINALYITSPPRWTMDTTGAEPVRVYEHTGVTLRFEGTSCRVWYEWPETMLEFFNTASMGGVASLDDPVIEYKGGAFNTLMYSNGDMLITSNVHQDIYKVTEGSISRFKQGVGPILASIIGEGDVLHILTSPRYTQNPLTLVEPMQYRQFASNGDEIGSPANLPSETLTTDSYMDMVDGTYSIVLLALDIELEPDGFFYTHPTEGALYRYENGVGARAFASGMPGATGLAKSLSGWLYVMRSATWISERDQGYTTDLIPAIMAVDPDTGDVMEWQALAGYEVVRGWPLGGRTGQDANGDTIAWLVMPGLQVSNDIFLVEEPALNRATGVELLIE